MRDVLPYQGFTAGDAYFGDSEGCDDANDLGHAGVFAILQSLPGFREVAVEIRIDDALVSTEVIEVSLTNAKPGGAVIGFPTSERLGRVLMYVGLRLWYPAGPAAVRDSPST